MVMPGGGILSPELQKYMQQARLQNWIGSLAQGLMQAGAQGRGVGTGLLQGLAGASAGQSDPMSAIRMQAQLESLAANKEERERESRLRESRKELLGLSPAGIPPGTNLASAGDVPRAPSAFAEIPREIREMAVEDPVLLRAIAGERFAKPKAPTTREVVSGDERLEQIFAPEHPDAGPHGYVTTHSGPRYKPPGTDLGGAVSEIGKLMTETQAGKRAVDLEDRRVAVTQMASQGANLINNLAEGGDRAVSFTGKLARGLETLSSQTGALVKEVGFDIDPERFEFSGKLAEESSVIKSQILGLAAAVTKADQGARPSDFDVQMSLNRLGASSGSSETMARTIKSMLDEKMNDFAIDYRVRSGEDFDWGAELGRHGIEFPEMREDVEFSRDDLEREMQRRGLLPGG